MEGIDYVLPKEFQGVLTNELELMRTYVAPRMRFQAQMPSEGGS